jgi:hypothetical protein
MQLGFTRNEISSWLITKARRFLTYLIQIPLIRIFDAAH